MFEVDQDGIPKDPGAYRSQAFWEWRYSTGLVGRQQRQQQYDWFSSTLDKIPHLLSALQPPCARILVLGCGTSSLSEQLQSRGMSVTSVDYAPSCISYMQSLHPDMDWRVADIREMHDTFSCEPPFDAIIDKATLDALWSDGGSPWAPDEVVLRDVQMAMSEAHRLLRPGGLFMSISLAQPHFRLHHLTTFAPWSTISDPIKLDDSIYHVYRMFK